jgi:integrase
MGYIYRPRLKDATPPPERKSGRCTHERHGHEDVCPKCGARFSRTWWAKYYVNGTVVRVSTETEKETAARAFLKQKEGDAATGRPLLPRADRILYDEAAADLRTYYKTTGKRNLREADKRLKHLDAFFRTRRICRIGPADAMAYVAARQLEGAANGTINRDLAVLGRMLKLAYENGKLFRLPILRKLKEAAPRAGFFERAQFEAVKRHLRPDLQVAVSIEYAFGWRTQSEVLTLKRSQVDLNACTLRLEPGTTKNDDGRLVYLTPELVAMLQAQDDRIKMLEMLTGRAVPYLFPNLEGRHRGQRINDFRKAWAIACREATLDLEELDGEARKKRRAELDAAAAKGEKPGLLKMLRHDFRRTAVRNMVNRGVPERVAMKVTGHKTRAVFDRYHIVSPADLKDVAAKLTGTFSGTLTQTPEHAKACDAGSV